MHTNIIIEQYACITFLNQRSTVLLLNYVYYIIGSRLFNVPISCTMYLYHRFGHLALETRR